MPYNTRRKSLSLPSLGIHVPARAAGNRPSTAHGNSSNRSPSAIPASPATSTPSTSSTHAGAPSSPPTSPDGKLALMESPRLAQDKQRVQSELALSETNRLTQNATSAAQLSPQRSTIYAVRASPSAKKIKFAHATTDSDVAPTFSPNASPRMPRSIIKGIVPKSKQTPPPSPPRPCKRKSMCEEEGQDDHASLTDFSQVLDEIVQAVIVCLQDSSNRPQSLKELTASLSLKYSSVKQSANPCAFVSSRLAAYLKRPGWTTRRPCPLGKELERSHPRRTYFYLTTCPRQPPPDSLSTASMPEIAKSHTRNIATPSLSSASDSLEDDGGDDDIIESGCRRELSPSPEIDLSSPDFDDVKIVVDAPQRFLSVMDFDNLRRGSLHAPRMRVASPPLEKDEREFTQTADGLQKRKLSGHFLITPTPYEPPASSSLSLEAEDAIFAEAKNLLTPPATRPALNFVASPALTALPLSLGSCKPSDIGESWSHLDQYLDWDRNPETIGLDELDGLMEGF